MSGGVARAARHSAVILYPGEMGCAVGKALVAAGWDVSTHLEGPSLVCRGDVEATAIVDAASLDEALGADVAISLVPPAAAVEVARAVSAAARRAGRRPLYLDANSVAPATVLEVAAAVAEAGLDCVDGCFIGSAAEVGGRTRLYLSGPRAGELAPVLPEVFRAVALGPEIGAASALKLAFAGFNKGLVALFLDVMAAGGAAGGSTELSTCLGEFYPGTLETLARLLPSYPRHAARRADELGELVRWLRAQGLDAGWAEAARDTVARFAGLDLDPERTWTLAEVVDASTAATVGKKVPTSDEERSRP